MPEPTLVRDLFDLPDQVRKNDFTHKHLEGLQRAEESVNTYVVTPGIRDSLDRALGLVSTALTDGRSLAAYVHGSFGSGKSHFMTLLSLLLDGQEVAWRVPAVHPLRDKYAFAGKSKLLQLHFHMIGKESIESAIFEGYLAHLEAHHADAPLPALFADEPLFEDAKGMLESIGEEAFFAKLNEGTAPSTGWGDLASAWSRETFDQAVDSGDPNERAKLFNVLAKTWFGGYTKSQSAFIDLDRGLGVISVHAKELGYEAIVLFLDELILWLAHRASEVSWLHNEVQKMVKLVEAQDMVRPVPFVSFIARQRSLVDMVGETYAGADSARLDHSLHHWEGRYDTIPLEDKNLPAIVEQRVLRPKNEEARAMVQETIQRLKSKAGPSWNTLLGQDDEEAFKKLYPYSPALIETLVALSSSLQRQRTAIRLLVELIVEHGDDVQLGELFGVGDIFDALAGGEDPADGVMRSRFDAAKHTYRYQLLPLIQKEHGTTTAETCQRERRDHPVHIGCSNCPNKSCRLDNRLVKTMLIAALVPQVHILKDLTASRLYQLNHGTLKVPIPGTEANVVVGKLKKLAASVGQLHVQDGTDPRVWVTLEGVDLKPIIDRARQHDSLGARRGAIKTLLFEQLGIDPGADAGRDHSVDWHHTKRKGHVRFDNVRTMATERLACPTDHDYRIIVDYPFDEPGHGPNEDLEVIQKFQEEETGTWSIVWLPSFFSKDMTDLLGEYVVLQHILSTGETTRQHTSHLSTENQSRARTDLENLRNQKKNRLIEGLNQAYGLANARDGFLDPSQSVESHLLLLKPGAAFQPGLATGLDDAVQCYATALLDARYARHPHFGVQVTPNRVRQLVEKFGEMVDAEDHRIPIDKQAHKDIAGVLGELGLARVSETHAFLVPDRILADIEKKRAQHAVAQPTVAEVRRWIDENRRMGLLHDAMDLVVRCYARHTARALVLNGKAYDADPRRPMPDEVELEKPDLPSQAEWALGLERAQSMLAVTFAGRALHGENLRKFESAVRHKLESAEKDAIALPDLLRQWVAEAELEPNVDRLVTAISASELCVRLKGVTGAELVRRLGAFEAKTSAQAVGRSMLRPADAVRELGNSLARGVFAQLRQLTGKPEAAQVLSELQSVLRQDELHEVLAERLPSLAETGQRVVTGSTSTGTGKLPSTLYAGRRDCASLGDLESSLNDEVAKLRAKASSAGEGQFTLDIKLTRKAGT